MRATPKYFISLKHEKEYFDIENEFNQGLYLDNFERAKRFVKRFDSNNPDQVSAYIKAMLLKAKFEYASFYFKDSKLSYELAFQAYTNSTGSQKAINAISLSQYLDYTHNFATGLALISQAEKLILNDFLKEEVKFNKAILLSKCGFYNEAKEILESYNGKLNRNLSKPYSDSTSMFLLEENDKQQKEDALINYLFVFHKSKIYNQPISLTKDSLHKELLFQIGKIPHSNKEKYKFTNFEAENLAYAELDYQSAILFGEAYQQKAGVEFENDKTYLLLQTIEKYIDAQDQVKYKNYLRRLFGESFKQVGALEYQQAAYSYLDCYRLFKESAPDLAMKRLKSALKTYKFLPSNHVLLQKMWILKATINWYEGQVDDYLISLDTILAQNAKSYGVNSPIYHNTYFEKNNFLAKYLSKDSASIVEMNKSYNRFFAKNVSQKHKDNVRFTLALSEGYQRLNKKDSCLKYGDLAVKLASQIYHEKHYYYFNAAIYNLMINFEYGNYGFVNNELQNIVNQAKNLKNSELAPFISSFYQLAKLCKNMGDIENYQYFTNKANNIINIDQQPILVTAFQQNLAAKSYFSQLNYFKADRNLLLSQNIYSKVLGTNSVYLLDVYKAKASSNLQKGNLKEAELAIEQCKPIANKKINIYSLPYIELQLLAAEYYTIIADYTKAEAQIKNCEEKILLNYGKVHLTYVEILLKKVAVMAKMKQYTSKDILPIYEVALKTTKDCIGEKAGFYHEIRIKLAEYLISINELGKANDILIEEEKYASQFKNENIFSAYLFLLQGEVCYKLDKYVEAEKKYAASQSQYEQIFGTSHPLFVKCASKLARVYYMKGQTDIALKTMNEMVPVYLDFIDKYFPSMSFREKNKYWNTMKEEFEFHNFLLYADFKHVAANSPQIYNNIINTKAIMLASSVKLREQIFASKDSALIGLYTEWITQKELLTNSISLSKEQLQSQNINLDLINNKIENIEKELSKRSSAFQSNAKKRVDFQEIRKVLPPNSCAIEILKIRKFNKYFKDSAIYCGLVIKPESNLPEIVYFQNGTQMENKIFKYHRNSAIYHQSDEFSYDVYWKPLKNVIKDDYTVYFSGDGVYNQLNIEMMKDENGKFAIDKNQFVYVTNTKDLLQANVASKSVGTEYLLCGNPAFYNENFTKAKKTIPSLPGAESEVLALTEVLKKYNKKSFTLTSARVSEDSLKHMLSPRVFHIATHGYFKESDPNADEDDFTKNPLLNSGLMLLESGEIIDDPSIKYVNQKEGILTAYEAMNMYLDNTDLVILSACETGRGEVRAGEGVYGLQRSFLIAGSKSVIMSLFKVDDEVTMKLMSEFYEQWLKTGNARDAFTFAKRKIKETYSDPVLWGAFIMIEGKPGNTSTGKKI